MSTKKAKQQLVPAVAYVRKSTKGKRADGSQRQEKSIPQQRTEIKKLASSRYDIRDWFEDEGISGSKRGHKRPGFQQMLDGVKDLGAQAIVCDHIDRFSRAAFDEVQEDVNTLRKAGVRWIITVTHGEFDLGARFDIGAILKFVVAVWYACEAGRTTGRRVTLARGNAAEEGKRTGGKAPYGWAKDGKHSLKHGPKERVTVVRWIFDQFANKGATLPWLAEQLNFVKKVEGPTGGRWSSHSLRQMLRNPVYKGDFVYNKNPNGLHFTLDAKGSAVERGNLNGEKGKLYRHEGLYPAMVSKAVFEKAQRRLVRSMEKAGGRSTRQGKYALSGILVCGHCGETLCAKPAKKGGRIVYICDSIRRNGASACKPGRVREDLILPFVVKLLGEELSNFKSLLTLPPQELSRPNKRNQSESARTNQQVKKLTQRIANARESLYDTDDKATRSEIDKDIKGMREELSRLQEQSDAQHKSGRRVKLSNKGKVYWLEGNEKVKLGGHWYGVDDLYTEEELANLTQWHEDFQKRAVSVPVSAETNLALAGGLFQDPFSEESAILIDALAVNDALHQLGTKVTLRWKTVDTGEKRLYTTRHKDATKRKQQTKPRREHVLEGGRFQLGQKKGRFSAGPNSLRQVRFGEPSEPAS